MRTGLRFQEIVTFAATGEVDPYKPFVLYRNNLSVSAGHSVAVLLVVRFRCIAAI